MAKRKIKSLTWRDISIDTFQRMQLIQDVDGARVERYIELIGLLYGISDPNDLTLEEYTEYMSHLGALQNLPNMATSVEDFHVVNGKRFRRLVDVNKMTGGEFIDFSVIRRKNDFADTLAVLYRNEDMSHKERSMWIRKHETVEGAYPYLSFFLRCMKISLQHIQTYSLGLAQKKRNRLRQA